MAWYKAQWAYRSDLWPEPIAEGAVLDVTDDQAAMLNRDSPGVLKPVKMAEVDDKPKDKPKPKAEDKPKARVVEEPPKTTAKRSPRKRTKAD